MNKLNVALFAGAAAALLAVPAAQAAVITVTLPTPLGIPSVGLDGIYINVVTGVSGTAGSAVPGWDINPYNNNTGLTFYGAASPSGILVASIATPATTSVALSLAPGASVSSAGIYNQFQTVGSNFQTAGDRYVGFRFLNETTSATNYGWMLIRSSAGTAGSLGFPASVLGYSYENTGLAVTVPVPEASTYAMMGLGLAGLAGLGAYRRRRAA